LSVINAFSSLGLNFSSRLVFLGILSGRNERQYEHCKHIYYFLLFYNVSVNCYSASDNSGDIWLQLTINYFQEIAWYFELIMFRAVRQIIIYIPKTALYLDTIRYKHMVILLHVSAFLDLPQGGVR
jgi:hypothetical protein